MDCQSSSIFILSENTTNNNPHHLEKCQISYTWEIYWGVPFIFQWSMGKMMLHWKSDGLYPWDFWWIHQPQHDYNYIVFPMDVLSFRQNNKLANAEFAFLTFPHTTSRRIVCPQVQPPVYCPFIQIYPTPHHLPTACLPPPPECWIVQFVLF